MNESTTTKQIIINFKDPIFALAKINKKLGSPRFKSISNIIIIVGIIFFALINILKLSDFLMFFAINLLAISTFLINLKLYFDLKIKNYVPKIEISVLAEKQSLGNQIDISPVLNFEAALLLKTNWGNTLESIFLKICQTREASFILYKAGLSTQYFSGLKIDASIEEILKRALESAAKNNQRFIYISDLFWGFASSSKIIQDTFYKSELDTKDLENLIFWEKTLMARTEAKSLLDPENWTSTGGIAKDWSSGYTIYLDQFGKDLTSMVSGGWLNFSVVSRENLTREMETALSKQHSHLIMVGEAGVGKRALVLEFARKVLHGKTLDHLNFKRIIEIDTGLLVAGAHDNEGEIETRLQLILNDAVKAGNVIIFIDNIHSIFIKDGYGTANLSQILIPYLESGRLQLIGATNLESWHKISANSNISSLFNKLEVPETDKNQTLKILQDLSFKFEYKYKIAITYQGLNETYNLAKKYIPYEFFPAKAIDLLEEAAIFCQNKRSNYLTPELLKEVVSNKTSIPVSEANDDEKNVLLHLEQFLHERIVGQDKAIKTVASALRRARAGLKNDNRPVASFLFLGPTGVGKTETCKALAKAYFGSERNMLRLDMSEYQEVSAIHKLLGSDQEAGGYLTKPIREKPFTLILLDEVEKAHPDILNLFLQVLDDGRITDNLERTIDFTHAIIIATSNAGSELIREHFMSSNADTHEFGKILIDKLLKDGIFKPEFLNRFDGVITFTPLSKEEINAVARLLIKGIARQLDEKGIALKVTDGAINKLSELGFDPAFGARQMRRVVQDKLEDFIAEKILGESLERGDSITFDVEDIKG